MKYTCLIFLFILVSSGIALAQPPTQQEEPGIVYRLVPGQEALPIDQRPIQQVTTSTKTFTVKDVQIQLDQLDQEVMRLLQLREGLRKILLLAQKQLGLTKIFVPPAVELTPPLPQRAQEDEQG